MLIEIDKILSDFFDSIGITSASKAEWDEIKSITTPHTKFKVNRMALK